MTKLQNSKVWNKKMAGKTIDVSQNGATNKLWRHNIETSVRFIRQECLFHNLVEYWGLFVIGGDW